MKLKIEISLDNPEWEGRTSSEVAWSLHEYIETIESWELKIGDIEELSDVYGNVVGKAKVVK